MDGWMDGGWMDELDSWNKRTKEQASKVKEQINEINTRRERSKINKKNHNYWCQ